MNQFLIEFRKVFSVIVKQTRLLQQPNEPFNRFQESSQVKSNGMLK